MSRPRPAGLAGGNEWLCSLGQRQQKVERHQTMGTRVIFSIDTPPLAPHISQLLEDTNGIKTDTALTMYYI